MNSLRYVCAIIGHAPTGEIYGVGTNVIEQKFDDPNQRYAIPGEVRKCGYRMRLCKLCGKRIPISPEDAEAKERIIADIPSSMNGARARYGLRPISWDI